MKKKYPEMLWVDQPHDPAFSALARAWDTQDYLYGLGVRTANEQTAFDSLLRQDQLGRGFRLLVAA